MEYKVSELAQKAGVTKRTIHYYISKGLLLPPNGNGVNSTYDDSHLKRILLIKQLQADFMPLNKIRDYILENPNNSAENYTPQKTKEIKKEIIKNNEDAQIYLKENICNLFEIHYSQENGEKYKHIIENVKKYVEKMLED